jgi:hypothetical protein
MEARMSGVAFTRRAALATLVGLALAPRRAFAQDPRAAVVQKVARDWLALADKIDAAATWNAAGARFQQAITAAGWAESLRRGREPRGAIDQRAVIVTTLASAFPGLPAGGNYALVRFRTSFANHANGGEDVTLEMGPDSVWRVIGYVIR